jgi:D-glycero-alpha-D-manno-heptose-7-phosphate kinase
MIITRTPFRMSFFGGGTDYAAWCDVNGGAALSTTIDKYCWITCRRLPPFFAHKSRIIYSHIEMVKTIDEINHPSVRECLRFLDIREGVEIHHDGDLPARTGLGSSSSFTVGLLLALRSLLGQMVSKERLAGDAIHVEQCLIRENVGAQDQVAAAYGGLNCIEFGRGGRFRVQPVALSAERLQRLQDCLMLFFTGLSRTASEVAAEQIRNVASRAEELHAMRRMVDRALEILTGTGDMTEFGQLLHESWQLKKRLSNRISNGEIDRLYEVGREAGAVGGKLLGAGGGGFVLLYVPPEKQERVRQKLHEYLHVPVRFENLGAQVVFYHP